MNIGIVCYPTYGGSGIVATELGKALADKGHQVHFISYNQPVRFDIFSENMFYHEVSISDYPLFEYTPYELTLTSKLVDVAIHEKLDLLHVHYAIPHASSAFLAKKILLDKGYNVPFVTTLHGTDITLVGRDESFKPVIEFVINHSDAVTAVSKSLKKDTLKYFNINKEINVIPNFIDFQHYQNYFDHRLHKYLSPKNEFIITHVSNFRKVKRVDDVVKIFNIIRQNLSAKLLLVGDGPERAKIEKLCRKLSLNDSVKFMGKSKSIKKIMSISDLFLLPSEAESFGLVALEAMASSVPVVSSNVGGLPELNIYGYTGFLSPIGDIDQMAKQSLEILNGNLKKFKSNALKHSAKYDLVKILPKYEALYKKLI